jgi:dipeptidyl aminopeptidase/acylaminoacyl peptidase
MKAETSYPISRYLNIHSAYHPKFFSDSRHVAFISDITGIPQAWKVRADVDSVCWPEQLTFETERVQWLACSPVKGDDHLIFGRDVGGNENAQIYLIRGDGSEVCLTGNHSDTMHLPGEWSRDGRSLLFAANRRKPSIFDAYIQHLNGEAEFLWENDQPGYLRDLSFSLDGGRALCSRIQSSFSHQIFEIDIAAKEVREISPTKEEARYLAPCYAPDGASIYLFTDVDSDFLYLARMDLQSLELETVQDLGWDVGALAISPSRRFLGYEVNVKGSSKLYAVDLKKGETTKAELGETPGVVNGTPVFNPDSSTLAFSYSNATKPLDIYLWDLKTGGIRRVTNSTTGGIPPESFSAPELVHYPTFDEDVRGKLRMIPAWFYRSLEGERSPVIVLVHGGPESQTRPRFDFRVQYFLNKGYGVFLPNVRGSTGYGKAYSHLDDARKRMDSVRDLAQGAQWLKEQSNVDGYSIAVMGGSYGGFMVLSSVTVHPDLWAAGIDVVGISNLATFLENTSGYRRRHREAEYGNLEEDRDFLENIAPVNHIDNIKAPLLVIQGANDPRVPLSESKQMVKIMKEKGKPVEFIVFQDEGHGIVRLKNKRIAYPAIVAFLERHLHQTHKNVHQSGNLTN